MHAIDKQRWETNRDHVYDPDAGAGGVWPILICVLGPFRILLAGRPAPAHGEKTIGLLCYLALHYTEGVPRDTLLDLLWPDSDATLAAEALHSRVHSVQKLLSRALGGAAPVIHDNGCYRLNAAAGVGVDIACFDEWASAGDRHARAGAIARADAAYRRAVRLYQGDLAAGMDIHALLERERLCARYLNMLAALAEYAFANQDHAACLDYALRLLDKDPCREDAHRLVMRCYVRCGQRAQALRQYRLCAHVLHAEFAAVPEPATVALFDQIRLDPASV
jgi:DNA-binding SARP family transcriptional activator